MIKATLASEAEKSFCKELDWFCKMLDRYLLKPWIARMSWLLNSVLLHTIGRYDLPCSTEGIVRHAALHWGALQSLGKPYKQLLRSASDVIPIILSTMHVLYSDGIIQMFLKIKDHLIEALCDQCSPGPKFTGCLTVACQPNKRAVNIAAGFHEADFDVLNSPLR
ncbi:hypothetical protein SAICODRAFT_30473 [Saitoella complicata NRRL Y-17804]|uniref:uncharacterized protein n=1 Tax=Saitoella complicata (strain BCRC 22490 / CBS 7301 / JCM 7358 / NBRC 10748 / NRRL Y-17804) TaxID=698492 RepID=UPI000867D5FD|nr:uncharacterized protein SAICODRAFT_30473 [Saitoella complicata NRRL Y-17804]ODQ53073.1 hypothetical protein SAICODRAFT_30473 [Saitoella complicata NRRL Y-17804]